MYVQSSFLLNITDVYNSQLFSDTISLRPAKHVPGTTHFDSLESASRKEDRPKLIEQFYLRISIFLLDQKMLNTTLERPHVIS